MTALILLASLLAAETHLAQAEAEGGLVQLLLRQPLREQWTAACRGRVTPHRTLVVGGMSARALKPSDARDQIEAQLEAMRSFIAGKGGTL